MKLSGRNVPKSFLVPRKVLEIGLSSSVLPHHNGAGSISIINTMKIISIESCLFIYRGKTLNKKILQARANIIKLSEAGEKSKNLWKTISKGYVRKGNSEKERLIKEEHFKNALILKYLKMSKRLYLISFPGK